MRVKLQRLYRTAERELAANLPEWVAFLIESTLVLLALAAFLVTVGSWAAIRYYGANATRLFKRQSHLGDCARVGSDADGALADPGRAAWISGTSH